MWGRIRKGGGRYIEYIIYTCEIVKEQNLIRQTTMIPGDLVAVTADHLSMVSCPSVIKESSILNQIT